MWRKFDRRIWSFGIFFLFAAFFLTPHSTHASGNVTATIVKPDGTTAITSLYAYLNTLNWSYYQSAYTNSKGVLSFSDVPDGSYTLTLYRPTSITESAPPDPFTVTVSGGNVDLGIIKFKKNNVTGILKNASGSPVTNMYVYAHTSDWSKYFWAYTDSSGNFGWYTANSGTYTLTSYDDYSQEFYAPGDTSFTVDGELGYSFGTVSGKSPNVKGKFLDSNGSVISSSQYPYVSFYNSDYTVYKSRQPNNSDGTFKLYVPKTGTYTVVFYVTGGIVPDSYTVTVSDLTSVLDLGTIRQPSPNVTVNLKKIDGTTAVANAWMSLHNSSWSVYKSGSTDSSGVWTTYLASTGNYCIDTYASLTTEADPAQTCFDFTAGNTQTVNLQMQAPSMKGKIVDSNGSAVSSASVYVYDSSYSWTKTSWSTTDSSGVFYTKGLPTGTYSVRVYPPYSSSGRQLVAPDVFTVDLTSGQTNTTYFSTPIALTQPNKAVNITVQDQNGTKISSGYISGWNRNGGTGYCSTQTNSNGQANCYLGKGEWNFSVYPAWTNGTSPDWGYYGGAKVVKFEQENSVTESYDLTIDVQRFTSQISGKILKPDGTAPAAGDYVSMGASSQSGFWNSGRIDANGDFSVKAPASTVTLQFWSNNRNYTSPDSTTYTVADGESLDIGSVYFVEKKESIACKVQDSAGTGLSGQYCYTWKDKGNGWDNCTTDAQGSCTLKVSRGDWTVMAYPSWNSTVRYACITGSQKMTLGADQTATATFNCAAANSTLKGVLQDSDGNTLDLSGWIEVRNADSTSSYSSGLGCSLSAGSFECKVPAGTFKLNLWVWNSEYSTVGETTATVGESEIKDDIVITMAENDANISGNIVDTDGNTLSDVSVSIMADNGNGSRRYEWVTDGSYSLDVAEGTWSLGVWVSWDSDYVLAPNQDFSVAIASEENKTMDIVLAKEDSTVTTTATDDTGAVLQNAFVSLRTKLGDDATTEATMYRFHEWAGFTDQNGKVSIKAPAGTYYVTCSLPSDRGLQNPEATKVTIDADTPANVTCLFRNPNATISGTVTDASGDPTTAFVYAWSDTDGYIETSTDDAGEYDLDIYAPDTWHVGAVVTDSDNTFEEAPEVTVNAEQEDTTYDVDPTLDTEAHDMPAATSNSFSSSDSTSITLEDGAEIIVPAFSVSETDQTVTVTATADAEAPHQSDGSPVEYAYDITALDSQNREVNSLADNVTITLPITDDTVSSDNVTPMYWDEEANEWRDVANVIVADDEVTFTTDHLTTFALVTTLSDVSSENQPVPQVSLTSPRDGTQLTTASVLVKGTVSDPDASLSITVNGSVVTPPSLDGNGGFSKTVTGLTAGENEIVVQAENDTGSSPEVTRTVSYILTATDGSESDDPLVVQTGVRQDILTVPNTGSPHVRLFDTDGTSLSSFFAFGKDLRGSFQVLNTDINGDGEQEILTAAGSGFGPHVRLFSHSGVLITDFFAYSKDFRGGVKMYLADITGNSYPELLVTPASGGGPHVRVYRYDIVAKDFVLLTDFFPYAQGFRGGVRIVTADVTGDGRNNIVVTPEKAGGPHVRVFKYVGSPQPSIQLVDDFFAYQENLRMGVKVMAADMTGEGVKDLVLAPYEGTNMGSNVRVYKYDRATHAFGLLTWVNAFGDDFRGSINIRVADLDNDGLSNIVVAPHENGGPNVRIYQYNALSESLDLVDWFMAYDEGFKGGVDFVISNLDNDDYSEIVTTPRHFGGPNLRAYEYSPSKHKFELMDWIMTHNEGFRGQLSVLPRDLDGDGDSELVVAPLENGGPNVRVFDYVGGKLTLSTWFMAYSSAFRGGVNVLTVPR